MDTGVWVSARIRMHTGTTLWVFARSLNRRLSGNRDMIITGAFLSGKLGSNAGKIK
jgi:hypothetical protein